MTGTRNPNSNVVSHVVLKDGTVVHFSHRDTLRGWKNGLERRGVSLSDLDLGKGGPGMHESTRVSQ